MTRLRAGRRSGAPALHVTIVDAAGRPARHAAPGLAGWLAAAAPRGARGALTIALVTDASMRRLNGAFRGQAHATDVLSFPLTGPRPSGRRRPADRSPARTARPVGPGPLGDIAIALGVARRQADAAGHALRTEIRILALHGLLHLLGYDHERDQGEMRRIEDRLRRRAGLPSGLIARVRRDGRR